MSLSKFVRGLMLVVALVLLVVSFTVEGAAAEYQIAAFTIFSLTSRANPNILAEKMYRQQWKRNSFGMWVAPQFVKAVKDVAEVVVPGANGENMKFTGAPIEVHKRFVTDGKTTLDIPVRVRLTGMPVYGDKPLEGKEESARVVFRTVKINLTRKAYSKPSLTTAQITLPYLENLMFEASDYLTQWWNDYHPGNFILTMCAGASRDLVAAQAEGGRSISYVSHPNFYTAGGGRVSYSGGRPGTAGYETSVMTAIDGLTNTSTDYISVALINSLVIEAQRLRIQPVAMKAGYARFVIWITDAQWAQLQKDTDFKDWYKRLNSALKDHPLATAMVCEIGGAVICVDQNLWGARTPTNPVGGSAPLANTVEYGYQPTAAERAMGFKVGNWIENRDVSDRKIGLLVGAGAMSVGVGVPVSGGKKHPSMSFVDNTKDYGAQQGIGVQTVQSVVRSDVFDYDGMIEGLSAGDFYENTSSLAFGTYSPDSLSF